MSATTSPSASWSTISMTISLGGIMVSGLITPNRHSPSSSSTSAATTATRVDRTAARLVRRKSAPQVGRQELRVDHLRPIHRPLLLADDLQALDHPVHRRAVELALRPVMDGDEALEHDLVQRGVAVIGARGDLGRLV